MPKCFFCLNTVQFNLKIVLKIITKNKSTLQYQIHRLMHCVWIVVLLAMVVMFSVNVMAGLRRLDSSYVVAVAPDWDVVAEMCSVVVKWDTKCSVDWVIRNQRQGFEVPLALVDVELQTWRHVEMQCHSFRFVKFVDNNSQRMTDSFAA